MALKEKIIKIFSLEEKKSRTVITLLSLIIQAVSIILILGTNTLFQDLIFWTLFFLTIFLCIILFFQFYSNELIIEKLRITGQFNREYDGNIKELLGDLEIPSVTMKSNESTITFEALIFSIQDNSNSLVLQTSERSEKIVSKMYKDLIVFIGNFNETISKSQISDVVGLFLQFNVNLRIKGVRILKKSDLENQTNTFKTGLEIYKTENEIDVIIKHDFTPLPWKELKKLMLG